MTRLLRSPKIVVGLCLSVVFVLAGHHRPAGRPVQPEHQRLDHCRARRMPPSAAHLLGTTQVQQDVLSQLLVGGRSTILVSLDRRRGGDRAGRAVRRDGGLLRRLGRRPAVHAGQHLPGAARAAAAHRHLRVPGQGREPERRGDRGHHRHHRLGVRRPAAAGPDPVHAQPGLRRLGPDHRREELADHGVRDPAQPDPGGGHLVPVHRHLRGRDLHGAVLPRRHQHLPLELGDDAVLGAERAGGPAGAPGVVVVRAAGAGGRVVRHRAGAAQLRDRRVRQPAAAGRRSRRALRPPRAPGGAAAAASAGPDARSCRATERAS